MRVYLSHSIRGSAGEKASADLQDQNCKTAIEIAKILRRSVKKLNLYVPAENETFVKLAYDLGHLSEKQILDIDCKIIDQMDAVIVYVPQGDELQGGRMVEYHHATAIAKPVVIFHEISEAVHWLNAIALRL